MEKTCPLCNGKIKIAEKYWVCDSCRILSPQPLEDFWEEMEGIKNLQNTLCEHLHTLEQKQISLCKMSKKEIEEIELWKKQNDLAQEITFFADQSSKKEIRLKELYPRIYTYMNVVNRLKELYQ